MGSLRKLVKLLAVLHFTAASVGEQLRGSGGRKLTPAHAGGVEESFKELEKFRG